MRPAILTTMLLCGFLGFATSASTPGNAIAKESTPEPTAQTPSISPAFGYRWVEPDGGGTPTKQYEAHISGVTFPDENLIVMLRQDTSDTNLSTRFKTVSTFMKSEPSGVFKARIPFKSLPSDGQNIQIIVSTGTKYQTMPAPKSIGTVANIKRADELLDKEVTGAYIAEHKWGKEDLGSELRIDECSVLVDSEARWYKYTDNSVCPPEDHYYVKVTGAYGTVEDCLTVSFDYEVTVPNVIESTIVSVNGASQFCAIFYQGTSVTPLQGEAIIHYPAGDEYVDADDGVDVINDLVSFLAEAAYCPEMFGEE